MSATNECPASQASQSPSIFWNWGQLCRMARIKRGCSFGNECYVQNLKIISWAFSCWHSLVIYYFIFPYLNFIVIFLKLHSSALVLHYFSLHYSHLHYFSLPLFLYSFAFLYFSFLFSLFTSSFFCLALLQYSFSLPSHLYSLLFLYSFFLFSILSFLYSLSLPLLLYYILFLYFFALPFLLHYFLFLSQSFILFLVLFFHFIILFYLHSFIHILFLQWLTQLQNNIKN